MRLQTNSAASVVAVHAMSSTQLVTNILLDAFASYWLADGQEKAV